MKKFASLAFGAVAFGALLGWAQPADATGGPYVDPNPVGVSTETLKEYCHDYSYRQRHNVSCARFYRIDDHRDYNDKDHNRRHHHHDHDNDTTPN